MPDETEAHALVVLMLPGDPPPRRSLRRRLRGLLREQGRSRLDLGQIAVARRTLYRAVPLGGRGRYVLEAAIASLQLDDPPDWPQIAALYARLAGLTGSPVVERNRAAAFAEAWDVEAGLPIVDKLDLDRYQSPHATRAELLRRLGRTGDARAAYDRARTLVHSDAERRFLEHRRAQLGG